MTAPQQGINKCLEVNFRPNDKHRALLSSLLLPTARARLQHLSLNPRKQLDPAVQQVCHFCQQPRSMPRHSFCEGSARGKGKWRARESLLPILRATLLPLICPRKPCTLFPHCRSPCWAAPGSGGPGSPGDTAGTAGAPSPPPQPPPTARAPKLTSAVAERPPARDKSTTSRHITGHAAARRCRREDTGRGCPRASAAGSLAPSPHPLWPASRRPHRPPRAAAPLPEALTAGNALGRGRRPPALLRPPPRTSAAAPWRCTPAPPEAAASQVRRSGAGRGRGTCAAFRRVPMRTTGCSAMVPGWGGPAPLPPARRTPG